MPSKAQNHEGWSWKYWLKHFAKSRPVLQTRWIQQEPELHHTPGSRGLL